MLLPGRRWGGWFGCPSHGGEGYRFFARPMGDFCQAVRGFRCWSGESEEEAPDPGAHVPHPLQYL
ncbi:hypothetical protein GCM10010326_64880 [Streptomyces xanthochromogenes]|uniref:Uncharacterized protein n=1 Tax=Streptomyces xanthochromogenes TaxID=67384 RepID=A0ABQ3AP93_9ACTN|nr:hypothetical protein GCM10010326_64880 [Streptomyces xanthochromogenes]